MMDISVLDMLRAKSEAKKLRKNTPSLSQNQALDEIARSQFGFRNFHEMRRRRQQAINLHVNNNSDLANCDFCGFSFCADISEDRRQHSCFHDAYEEATLLLGYIPQQYAAREAAKKDGYEKMQKGTTLDVRMFGAEQILRAWFDRSLDAAIDKKYWKNHPDFGAYVSYIIGATPSFPSDVVAEMINRYGRKDGVILAGKSYWYPPKR